MANNTFVNKRVYRQLKKRAVIAILLVTIITLPTFWFAGYYAGRAQGGSTPVFEHPAGSYSYLIWRDGSTYYAKNGETGAIDYSGTNASAVIQSAKDALTGGGLIFIKAGAYSIDSPITFNNNDKRIIISGEGEETEIVHSANINIFEITGLSRWITFKDLKIKSDRTYTGRAFYIDCNPTGSPPDKYAAFILFENLRIEKFLHGAIYARILWISNFVNVYIRESGDATHPVIDIKAGSVADASHDIKFDRSSFEYNNDANYVVFIESPSYDINFNLLFAENFANYTIYAENGAYGVKISNSRIMDSNITGVSLGTESLIENSLISAGDIPVSIGYIYNKVSGSIIVATNDGGRAVYVGSDYNIIANCPEIKADVTNGEAVKIAGSNNTVTNNILSGKLKEVNEVSGDYNEIKNNQMINSKTVSKVGSNTKIWGNTGFVTENYGTATISASTSVTFNHGLAGTPTHVEVGWQDTGYGTWSWSATATNITITVTSSGTYNFSWKAEYEP